MKLVRKTNNISPRLRRIESQFPAIKKHGYEEFRKVTPKRTGNAKNSTTLRGDEIQGNYAYANRLNEGYSRQAPKGMTDPTIDSVQKYVRRIVR
jgi:hypothetical protein